MHHVSVCFFLLGQNDLIEALNVETIFIKTFYIKCVLMIFMLISSPQVSCASYYEIDFYMYTYYICIDDSTTSVNINIIL